MGALIAKRISAMLVILIVLIAVLFFLKQISPGDPVHLLLGGQASAATIAHERHVLGLDHPVTTQFAHYLDRLIFHADYAEPCVKPRDRVLACAGGVR